MPGSKYRRPASAERGRFALIRERPQHGSPVARLGAAAPDTIEIRLAQSSSRDRTSGPALAQSLRMPSKVGGGFRPPFALPASPPTRAACVAVGGAVLGPSGAPASPTIPRCPPRLALEHLGRPRGPRTPSGRDSFGRRTPPGTRRHPPSPAATGPRARRTPDAACPVEPLVQAGHVGTGTIRADDGDRDHPRPGGEEPALLQRRRSTSFERNPLALHGSRDVRLVRRALHRPAARHDEHRRGRQVHPHRRPRGHEHPAGRADDRQTVAPVQIT